MTYLIIQIATGVLISIIGFFMKNLYSRLDTLESRSRAAIDEMKVRQIIEDKLAILAVQTSDIKEDVKEIKAKIDYIINETKTKTN